MGTVTIGDPLEGFSKSHKMIIEHRVKKVKSNASVNVDLDLAFKTREVGLENLTFNELLTAARTYKGALADITEERDMLGAYIDNKE